MPLVLCLNFIRVERAAVGQRRPRARAGARSCLRLIFTGTQADTDHDRSVVRRYSTRAPLEGRRLAIGSALPFVKPVVPQVKYAQGRVDRCLFPPLCCRWGIGYGNRDLFLGSGSVIVYGAEL